MSDAIASFGTQLKRAGTLVAENISVSVEAEADEIDVTSLDSAGGFKEVIHGKKSVTLNIEGNFIPTNSSQETLEDDWISGATATYTVVWPDGTTDTFPAKVMSFNRTAEVGSQLTHSLTLMTTGQPTFA